MIKNLCTGFFILAFSCFLIRCDTSDDLDDITEDSTIRAVVLRTEGIEVFEFWSNFNLTWREFGDREVLVDFLTFQSVPISYAELLNSDADVLIIDDANHGRDFMPYSSDEVTDILQYVNEGHGLFITGGTFRKLAHQRLISYTGFSSDIRGNVNFHEYSFDSIVILDPQHQIFNHLPNYLTGSHTFYSTSDWDNNGKKAYPGDWVAKINNPQTTIIGFIWNTNHLTGLNECTPISVFKTANHTAVFAGHTPTRGSPYVISKSDPSIDDFQFVYNTIVFCAEK